MIGYLNINHFENKVIHFGEICHQAPIDIICFDETKLDFSYPDSSSTKMVISFLLFAEIERNGGGKIVYVPSRHLLAQS